MKYFLVLAFLFLFTVSVFAVPFTLRNNSLKSIPLIITSYMNPNLSPKSNSGVDIPVGEKVYFKYKGKKQLLLVVTEDLKGQTLVVDKLIKEKIEELED
jgi:hypothetical protein